MTDGFPLEAGAIRLRRFRAGDLAAFQAYRRDEETGRFQSWERMSDERAARFIAAVAEGPVAPSGQWNQIAIARASDDALIGDVGVCVSIDEAEAEIGVTLAPAARGAGHGAAAVAAMIGWLFDYRDVGRVYGITDILNTPSARLMERAGMNFVRQEDAVFNGAPCVEATYETRR